RTLGCSHRLHQRPVGVLLAVFAAVIRPQEHSELIVSRRQSAFKRVGLHYIPVFSCRHCKRGACYRSGSEKSRNQRCPDELRLGELPRSGKPRRVSDAAIAWVQNAACQKPKELGYAQELWTYRLLTAHLRQQARSAGYP